MIRRLMLTLGVENEGMIIADPPSLRPGDIVLGTEGLNLLPQQVIDANADRVAIAVPDPETGELGLIRYEKFTPEDAERIAEYSERRRAAIEAYEDKLLDHLARMQEMGVEGDESWLEHERRRKEEGSG